MTDTHKPGAAGNSPVTTTTTLATRHACPGCGHYGDYRGPGPYACPGCSELMRVVEHPFKRRSERDLLLLAQAALHAARSASGRAAGAIDIAQARSEAVRAADRVDIALARIEAVLIRLPGAQRGAA